MGPTRGEVTTDLVDLSRMSLTDLRGSDDPELHRSIRLLAGRTECDRTGVLQNQSPEG